MIDFSFKAGCTRQIGYPFIRFLEPFICYNNQLVRPLVGCKIPFISYCRKCTGFTLIELLTVLTVVSILSFVAVPSIKNIIKDHRLSAYTNDLLSDLSFARSEAIKRASSVTVCKTSNPQNASPTCNTTLTDKWTSGRITFVDTDGDGVIDSGEQVLRIRQALNDQNSAIKGTGTASETSNRVTFRSDGTSTLTAETQIALCDDRGATQNRGIAINTSGRTRALQKGTGTITCP